MINEPKHISNEYYIEEGFADLAGPYETASPLHKKMLENVINDMERGNIEYRVVTEIYKKSGNHGDVISIERATLQRKGMILPKRSIP